MKYGAGEMAQYGKELNCQAWQSEFDSQDPQSVGQCQLSQGISDLHMHAITSVCPYPHKHTQSNTTSVCIK